MVILAFQSYVYNPSQFISNTIDIIIIGTITSIFWSFTTLGLLNTSDTAKFSHQSDLLIIYNRPLLSKNWYPKIIIDPRSTDSITHDLNEYKFPPRKYLRNLWIHDKSSVKEIPIRGSSEINAVLELIKYVEKNFKHIKTTSTT